MIKLILKFNGAVVKEHTLMTPEAAIGRKPDNDVVIDNPAVSGAHCRIFRDGAAYAVEDLNSTNGTFLRGRKVTREILRHKDELTVAKHVVEFYNDEEIDPAPPPSQEPVSTDATVILKAAPSMAVKRDERVGHLRVLSGGEKESHALTALTSYIGKSEQALIRIKGIFAPDLAACVAKKADGYYLTALKEKTVKVNGDGLPDQTQALLKEGDLVDVGHLKMMFFYPSA